MQDSRRKMYVECPIIVRGYDVDFMNIVNNTIYVKWLEDLRMAILDKYLPLTEMLQANLSPILAETNIQYKRPITFGCHPTGKCWIWLTRKGRWTAEHIIEENGTVFATAQQTGYCFNIATKRPAPFPQHIIDQYLIPD